MATVDIASPQPAARSGHKLVGRIGPWQLLRKLGEGSLTRVYLAQPTGSDSAAAAYAVKLLRNEWWREPKAIARQRREAWIGSRVSHPNVVPVLTAGIDGPPFYLVMPKLDGSNLARLLEDDYRPPIPVALWVVRQVAEGLQAVHSQTGMIHADVKPANIMLDTSGHATLIDFGFAQSAQEASYWADRPVVGTLNYIAPEMVTSALAADQRSDIYGLGVTLYELLSGQLPLESDDPSELAEMHRQVKPTCIRELRPDLPKPVASLVHRMLAKEAIRRPATFAQLVEELIRLEIECFELR